MLADDHQLQPVDTEAVGGFAETAETTSRYKEAKSEANRRTQLCYPTTNLFLAE